MKKLIPILLLLFLSCSSFTYKDFQVLHLKTVAEEVRLWDLDNPKLMTLYKLIGGGDTVEKITERERKWIILRLIELSERLEASEITCETGCATDVLFFHEAGEYEVHNLLGGFKLIYYCASTNCAMPTMYIEKDGRRIEIE